MQNLTDDGMYTYLYDGVEGVNNMSSAQEQATAYNYNLQGKQTYIHWVG